MRKLILSMQISLDGYVDGPGGDLSWILKEDPETWQDLFTMLQNVDTFLLGRGMFNDYRDYWKQALTNPQTSANHLAYAKLAEKTKHVVVSNSLKDPQWANTEVMGGALKDVITKLKSMPGKDIQVVGGAKFATSVIESGLVDEYRFTINPILLGGGKSIFKDQHGRQTLELFQTQVTKPGLIIARYRPK